MPDMQFGLTSDLWILWQEVVQLSPFGSINVESANLDSKWAIVSGASQGIGLETAKMLAKAGCNVILSARPGNPGSNKGAKIVDAVRSVGVKDGVQVEFWPMDGESLADTRAFAEKWLQTGRALDFLVSNHGIAEPGIRLSKEGFERHYVIDYLSHAQLLLLLLPSLAKAKAPRCVGVTSCFHYFGREIQWDKLSTVENEKWVIAPYTTLPLFMSKYGRAKLCLAMFYKELSIRLGQNERYRHIILHSVHPGAVDTSIFTDLLNWKKPLLSAGAYYMHLISISPIEGAKSLMKACVSDELERATRGGDYFNRAWRTRGRPEIYDPASRQKLWTRTFDELKISEKQVGL